MNLKLPFILLLVLSFQSFGQSKKEQIVALQRTTDSLQQANAALIRSNTVKSDSIAFLQKELTDYEGAYSEMTRQSSDAMQIIDQLKDSLYHPVKTISKWLLKNLELDVPEGNFTAANIKPHNFSKNMPKAARDAFFEKDFLGDEPEYGIFYQVHPNYVFIDLGGGYSQRVYISEDYAVVSCHAPIGDYARILVYNLYEQTVTELHGMDMRGFISSDVLEVGHDYYADYHIFESGSYNLRTKEYKMIHRDE